MWTNRSIFQWFRDMRRGMQAVTTQSYTEANSKLGVQHELSVLVSAIAGNTSNDTLFITGEYPIALKARHVSYTGQGVSAEIFKGATYSALGTEVKSFNASDVIPVAPIAKFYTGENITDIGIEAFAPEYVIGNESNQGKGGSSILGRERILAPNTVYVFRLRSLDSQPQDIAVFDSWYEGELDKPDTNI